MNVYLLQMGDCLDFLPSLRRGRHSAQEGSSHSSVYIYQPQLIPLKHPGYMAVRSIC